MASYGVPTHGYRMTHDSVNRRGDSAWAFMEVTNEDDGAYLIQGIGNTRYDGAPLRLDWAHDSIPGMLAEATHVTMAAYPE